MRPRTRPRTSRASRGFAPPLLALLALLALTRAPSASADVAGGASGSLGASEARGAARATPLRVGDAGARVARVTATPGEPFASAQAVEVRGFSRLTQPHKAFHHVTLEVFDDARSSFARNECELRLADGRRVKSARRGPGWPRKRDAVLKFAKADFVAKEKLSVADDRASFEMNSRSAPTLVADFGPFDATRVVVRCGVSPSSGFDRHDTNVRVRTDDAFTVTVNVTGNDRDVTTRRWRFILGTALAVFAPRLADVAAAYYVSGAIVGVAALALFFAAKAARIVPGGRAARTGAGIVAAVSAFVVPPEHVTKVLEMYVSLWLAPARLVVAAARRALFFKKDVDGARVEYAGDPNVSDEGALEAVTLAYALAGTALTLAGAGAGLWATNAWVIDKSTGEVAAPAAAFARVAARALGATLLQFCTADAALGGALASIALVSAVAESAKSGSLARALSFFFTRKRRRVSRGDARRESDSDRSRRSDWSDSDDEDAEERARGRFETNTTPRSRGSARGRSAQFSGSASGLRRRGRERARSRDAEPKAPLSRAESSDEEDARSPGWNWFGGASRSRRGRRRRRGDGGYGTPTTLDPEPRTPPVVLVGTGAGALGASPGRTPGAGLRPWRSLRGGSASPFSFGFFSRSPLASRDSDSEDDADGDALLRERHRAAAAAAAGARRAAGRSGRSGHVTRTRAAEANPVPVGMAARARGRFMTRAEYDAQGAERTDRGLDELCGTPEFAKWMAKQSHRVRLVATDLDSDEDR